MQDHLKDYIQFKTTLEGIELLGLIEEYDKEGVLAVSCQYVLCDGRDITEIVKDNVVRMIEAAYLGDAKDIAEQARLNAQLDRLESKQWNSTHS